MITYSRDHIEFKIFWRDLHSQVGPFHPAILLVCSCKHYFTGHFQWLQLGDTKHSEEMLRLFTIYQHKAIKLAYRVWRRRNNGWIPHMHRQSSKKVINNARLRSTCAYEKIPELRKQAMRLQKLNYQRKQTEVKPPPLPLP